MIKIGQKAPDFTLPSNKRDNVTLSEYQGKYVVLFFYPKNNTPGCTAEACDFRDNMARIMSKDTAVLGVSIGSPQQHQKFAEKHHLTYELIADQDGELCSAYDALTEINLLLFKIRIPKRMTILINPDGTIKKIWRNVKVTGHVDDILASV